IAFVVLRLPERRVVLWQADWLVIQHVAGWFAGPDRCGIDERLEGRSSLASSLNRAIELGVVEIAAAYQGADVAVLGIQRYQRALQIGRHRTIGAFLIVGLLQVLLIGRMLVRPEGPTLDR